MANYACSCVSAAEVTSLVAPSSPEMQRQKVNYVRVTRGKAKRDGVRDDGAIRARKKRTFEQRRPSKKVGVLNDQECISSRGEEAHARDKICASPSLHNRTVIVRGWMTHISDLRDAFGEGRTQGVRMKNKSTIKR